MTKIKEKVKKFIENNPNPKDEKFHAFAEKFTKPDKAEEAAYALLSECNKKKVKKSFDDQMVDFLTKGKEIIIGGKADNKPDSKYSKKEIKMGLKVEKEHTNNPKIAKEITKDHLEEDPKYYDRLKVMEDNSPTKKAKKSKRLLSGGLPNNQADTAAPEVAMSKEAKKSWDDYIIERHELVKGGAGSGRHKVGLGFSFNGKKYYHVVPVQAYSKNAAKEVAIKHIEGKLGNKIDLHQAHVESF